MTEETTMRKLPTTKRGKERVNKILDAAAELIVEMGYADITTNHIADRADTSVGSLYQYFKNKDTVLEALADRYLEQLHAVLDEGFKAVAAQMSLPDVVAYFLEGTLKFYTMYPGFEPLFFGAVKTESLEAIGHTAYTDMVTMMQAVLQQHLPQRPPDELQPMAHAVISLCKLQLPHRHNLPPELRDAYVKQVTAMARAYVVTLA
ncbi:MAG: TetR/AcrR family transcriptional regulator [Chloroflexota bacterium]